MIYLHTGQPGAGKTLFTLWHVKAEAERENRQVYYSGIAELQIPGWLPLEDEKKWYELPPGAIIIMDEAQRLFRPRGTGAAVPEYVAKLETHRHSGHDLYIITQHPMLIEQNVRRLTGTHRHIVRAFGSKAATVHTWGEVRENCDKSRSNSVRSSFLYPKEVFSWYKSAEVHTHKARIPWRVFALFVLPILIAALGYTVYQWLAHSGEKAAEQLTGVDPAASAVGGGPNGRRGPMTVTEYLELQSPRVPGLAYTAPKYDRVTEPTTAPIPAACLASESRGCLCYSQQGTRLDVATELCASIVERGFFVDFDGSTRDGERQGATTNDAQRRTAARPVERTEPGQDYESQNPQGRQAGSWGGIPASATWGGVR